MVATSAETPRQGLAGGVKGLAPVSVGLALIVVAFLVAFFPSIAWMAGEWSGSSGVLSHGYLVAVISAVLFVRAIPEVAASAIRPAWWLLPVLLVLSAVWLLAYVATVVAVQTLVLPAILLVAVAAAVGLKAAKPLAFPILYVYFAMPAWEHLQFIFQGITVSVVDLLLRVFDVPAFVVGNFVNLSVGTFEIAGGCSGLSFIVAGLSLAILYGYLFYRRWTQGVTLVAATVAVAMIGNWIRVFTIILIGYNSEMSSPMVDDHYTFGWIIFAVLMIPVYLLARRLEDVSSATRRGSTGVAHTNHAPQWTAVAVALALMIVGPVWASVASESVPEDAVLTLQLPAGSAEFPGPRDSYWGWSPTFAGPVLERVAEYGSDRQFVMTYVNLYLRQEQDRELIYYSNRIAGNWRDAESVDVAESVTASDGAVYRQHVARNYSGDWLIWYRYQLGQAFESSNVRAKLRQAAETLLGRPRSGVIAFAAPCRESCDQAAAVLAAFVHDVGNKVRIDYSREDQ